MKPKYILTKKDKLEFDKLFNANKAVQAVQLLQQYWPKSSKEHKYLLQLEIEAAKVKPVYITGIAKGAYNHIASRKENLGKSLLRKLESKIYLSYQKLKDYEI